MNFHGISPAPQNPHTEITSWPEAPETALPPEVLRWGVMSPTLNRALGFGAQYLPGHWVVAGRLAAGASLGDFDRFASPKQLRGCLDPKPLNP